VRVFLENLSSEASEGVEPLMRAEIVFHAKHARPRGGHMAIAVLVTIPEKDAEALATMLVSERVCACVNIIKGVRSLFWWKGKINTADEVILIIKTKDSLYAKLKTMIKNNHPYSVPEIISFKIDQINQEYMEWLNKEASANPTT
jgi:periplasmic divalent cation tolerance protein